MHFKAVGRRGARAQRAQQQGGRGRGWGGLHPRQRPGARGRGAGGVARGGQRGGGARRTFAGPRRRARRPPRASARSSIASRPPPTSSFSLCLRLLEGLLTMCSLQAVDLQEPFPSRAWQALVLGRARSRDCARRAARKPPSELRREVPRRSRGPNCDVPSTGVGCAALCGPHIMCVGERSADASTGPRTVRPTGS